MSELAKPGIVLVHGLWADASSFNRIIPVLQEEGYEVFAPQFGLDTVAGDVEAVKRGLSRVPSPVVLVGHSYGGTLITAAGGDDRVAGLVYIAGLAPDAHETSQSLQDKFPLTDLFKADQVEVHVYPGAGHMVSRVGTGGPLSSFVFHPVAKDFEATGGLPNANCEGSFDAWEKVLAFLGKLSAR